MDLNQLIAPLGNLAALGSAIAAFLTVRETRRAAEATRQASVHQLVSSVLSECSKEAFGKAVHQLGTFYDAARRTDDNYAFIKTWYEFREKERDRYDALNDAREIIHDFYWRFWRFSEVKALTSNEIKWILKDQHAFWIWANVALPMTGRGEHKIKRGHTFGWAKKLLEVSEVKSWVREPDIESWTVVD